jgi:hypothetical protein
MRAMAVAAPPAAAPGRIAPISLEMKKMSEEQTGAHSGSRQETG